MQKCIIFQVNLTDNKVVFDSLGGAIYVIFISDNTYALEPWNGTNDCVL